MQFRANKLTPYIPFLLIIVTAYIVYAPGLPGGFVFDDISNITSNPMIAMTELDWTELKRAAFSMDSRPISRASFGLNHLAGGYDPYGYKLVNLVIHIINGILVFFFSKLLINAFLNTGDKKSGDYPEYLFATLVALAWTLHPINLTNVLYVVQRMNSLSGMFVLAGLISYLSGRISLDKRPRYGLIMMLAAPLLFTPLAYFSKENGALLPGMLLVIEATIFRFQTHSKQTRKFLWIFFLLLVAVPALLAVYYIITHPGRFHAGFSNRHFTLGERLLTETRVIWLYVKMTLLPLPASLGLFHDDIPLSTGILSPITTLLSIVSLLGSVVLAVIFRNRAPIVTFGIFFFLVGHLMESTFIPLEIAFEHRNYLPSLGIIIVVFYYLLLPVPRLQMTRIKIYTACTLVLVLALLTYVRSTEWSSNARLFISESFNHPLSPRANYETGKLYGQILERGTNEIDKYYSKAAHYFLAATKARDNFTSGLFGLMLSSKDAGKEINKQWVSELQFRLENKPFEKVNLLWLRSLYQCVLTNRCTQEELEFEKLLQASLRNSYIKNKEKGILYIITSDYLYNVKKSPELAIQYTANAINTSPGNIQYRIRLAQLLLVAGKPDDALLALAEASRRDEKELYTQQIDLLNNRINSVNR